MHFIITHIMHTKNALVKITILSQAQIKNNALPSKYNRPYNLLYLHTYARKLYTISKLQIKQIKSPHSTYTFCCCQCFNIYLCIHIFTLYIWFVYTHTHMFTALFMRTHTIYEYCHWSHSCLPVLYAAIESIDIFVNEEMWLWNEWKYNKTKKKHKAQKTTEGIKHG